MYFAINGWPSDTVPSRNGWLDAIYVYTVNTRAMIKWN